MGKVTLTGKGRRWVLGGHPWVYADDLAGGEGEPGELLPVEDPAGRVVGWGLFSAHSKIAVRLVTRDAEQPTRAFWKERVARAIAWRAELGQLAPDDACRLLSGDAEGVPGLVIDRYADVLVVACGTQAADRMRDFLIELVDEVLVETVGSAPATVVDRSDASVRRLEGLERRVEVLRGRLAGPVIVREPGLEYAVDVTSGHKTGHYLDQRENRMAAAESLVRGASDRPRRVLDAFSYDGLFGIRAALAGAADVLCLDQNAAAGERLLENAERNGVADRVRFERTNAMKSLRDYADLAPAERYDLVVLDPPAFARNRGEVDGALRGYRELNLRGLAATRPGGRLVTSSCSYAVKREQFLDTVADAAKDAGRDVYLEEFRGAARDHPVHVNLPESAYLKCCFLRVGA